MTRRGHKILEPKNRVAREEALLLKNATELVTVSDRSSSPRRGQEMGNLAIIENGGLFARNGKILEVGESDILSSRYADAATVIDAEGYAVVPGFVDAHTHLVFADSREAELEEKLRGASHADIAEKGGGILETVRRTRASSLEDLISAASKRLHGMLRSGTTTAEVKTGYGLNVEEEVKMLRAVAGLSAHPVELVPTFMGAHAVPEEFHGRKEEFVAAVVNGMLPAVAQLEMARFCDVFVEEGYFSVNDARLILRRARHLGMNSKIHADEFSDCGGAHLAAEVRAVSADHLVKASESGLIALRDSGCIAVLLPATTLCNRMEPADGKKMVRMGLPVALGSDLNPGCWTESMETIISLACYECGLTPAEALTAATLNAAYAVGVGAEVGSLDPGKSADFVILNARTYRQLGFRLDGPGVRVVVKAGRIVVDKRKHLQ